MEKLDSSCCRREPKCVDPHVCDYYGTKKTHEKVRLGGIYDPKPPRASVTKIPPPEEPEEEDDSEARELERQQQCELSMKKFDFMKQPLKHPLAPCRNQTQSDLAKKKLMDMEKIQSATERIVEKFGGLTLGFTGDDTPTSTTVRTKSEPVVKESTRKVPDYPEELTMKRVCTPRDHPKRRLRVWENEDIQPKDGTVTASFTPPSQPRTGGSGQEKGDEKGKEGQVRSLTTVPSSQEMGDNGRINGKFYIQGSKERLHANDSSLPVSADELILEYVEKYNLEMMFEYFLALWCISHAPDNPFQFISDLAGKMIRARDDEEEFKNLERVFSTEHVAAIFRIFDKEQNGFVSLTQYKTGDRISQYFGFPEVKGEVKQIRNVGMDDILAMETLGLVRYNKEPEGHENDKITQESFVAEGTKALDLLLRSFLVVDTKS